jgi:hypothetical protein
MIASPKTARYLREHGATAYTPPDRAALHIRQLRGRGLTNAQISTAAGISAPTLHRIARLHGPITAATERRILAVPAPTGPTAGCLTATTADGTRRRLQALAVTGWPGSTIARRAGMARQDIDDLIHGRDQRTSLRTATRIAALFRQLWDQQPEQHGVRPAAAARARRIATAAGWHPAAAFDDLDDPNAQPQIGEQTSRLDAVVEDTAELAAEGYSREGIAARLGIQWEAVRQAHRRAGADVPTIRE